MSESTAVPLPGLAFCVNAQYWQLIVVAIFLAFSGIQWVLRKLAEQRQIKAAQEAELMRRDEMLRSGRGRGAEDGATPSALQQAKLEQQIAQAQSREQQERQRQLMERREMLRRQRQQQDASTANTRSVETQGQTVQQPVARPTTQPTGQSGPIRAELWPGGPVILINQGGAAPATPVRATAPARAPVPTRREPQRATPQQQNKQRQMTTQQRTEADRVAKVQRAQRQQLEHQQGLREEAEGRARVVERGRALRDAVSDEPVAAESAFDVPRTPGEWRRAFILSEILKEPVSMRKGGEHLD